MTAYAFALYDAFSATAFGGSQAAIVCDAATIDAATRQTIAREIGMPATAFVGDLDADWAEAQFFSTVMELPMCGHGMICLLTHLLENGRIRLDQPREIVLHLPAGDATVALDRLGSGRYRVMLDIEPPAFEAATPHIGELLTHLGLGGDSLSPHSPPEVSRGDFVHLILPLHSLDVMQSVDPDFGAIVDFCHRHGIETIAAFCRETVEPNCDLHVRDFCPAVGVAESAAAGTTNAALTCYLLRHGLAAGEQDSLIVTAEQGLELGRPSSIQSVVRLNGDDIERLQVGGVATRVMQGHIYL